MLLVCMKGILCRYDSYEVIARRSWFMRSRGIQLFRMISYWVFIGYAKNVS